jgi:hypothetical protein
MKGAVMIEEEEEDDEEEEEEEDKEEKEEEGGSLSLYLNEGDSVFVGRLDETAGGSLLRATIEDVRHLLRLECGLGAFSRQVCGC